MAAEFKMDAVLRVIDKVSTPMKKIMNNLSPITRQFSSIGNAASKFGGHLKNLAAPMAVLGGVASIAGIVSMVKSTISYGDAIANTAERIGWSSKALQEYSYVAKYSDMTNEEMASSLEKMTRNMGQLRAGSGSLLTGLEKVSPSLAKQLQAVKTNEEAFELMIKAIQKVEDPTKKAYLANIAFGKTGLKMIQVANHGADGIARLKKEANDLGMVLGKDAVNNSAAFNDTMDRMKSVLFGLSNTIGSKLLPIISPIIEKFSQWIVINRELISTKIEKFVERFAVWVKKIDFDKILNGISGFITSIGKLANMLGGLDNLFIAMIVLMNSGLIVSFLSLASGIGKLIAMILPLKHIFAGLITVMLNIGAVVLPLLATGFSHLAGIILSTPIGWFIGIVAIIAGLAYKIYKNWEPIKEFFSNLWGGVKDGFFSAWEAIKTGISAMGNWILKSSGIGLVLGAVDKLSSALGSKSSFDTSQSSNFSQSSAPNLSQSMNSMNANRNSKAEVVVKFDNMPTNANVDTGYKSQGLDLGVETGYALPVGVR